MQRLLSSCACIVCKFDRHFTLRCQDITINDWLLHTQRNKNTCIWLAKVQSKPGVCFSENLERFGFYLSSKFPQLKHHNCWSYWINDIFRHILPCVRDDVCNGLEETVPCFTPEHRKPVGICSGTPIVINIRAENITFDVKSGSKWRQLMSDSLPVLGAIVISQSQWFGTGLVFAFWMPECTWCV